MERFDPSYPLLETGANVRNFVKTNKSEFWEIFKPLLPFIVGLQFLDALISDAFFPESDFGFFWRWLTFSVSLNSSVTFLVSCCDIWGA